MTGVMGALGAGCIDVCADLLTGTEVACMALGVLVMIA